MYGFIGNEYPIERTNRLISLSALFFKALFDFAFTRFTFANFSFIFFIGGIVTHMRQSSFCNPPLAAILTAGYAQLSFKRALISYSELILSIVLGHYLLV